MAQSSLLVVVLGVALVPGLSLAAEPAPPAGPNPATDRSAGEAAGNARTWLQNGIDWYGRGQLERAQGYFHRADLHRGELTPADQRLLDQYLRPASAAENPDPDSDDRKYLRLQKYLGLKGDGGQPGATPPAAGVTGVGLVSSPPETTGPSPSEALDHGRHSESAADGSYLRLRKYLGLRGVPPAGPADAAHGATPLAAAATGVGLVSSPPETTGPSPSEALDQGRHSESAADGSYLRLRTYLGLRGVPPADAAPAVPPGGAPAAPAPDPQPAAIPHEGAETESAADEAGQDEYRKLTQYLGIASRVATELAQNRPAGPSPVVPSRTRGEQPYPRAQDTEQFNLPIAPKANDGIPLRAEPEPPGIHAKEPRRWMAMTYCWVPDQTCHYPTYFEDVVTERYGHYCCPIQPVLSAGMFYLDLAILPYQLIINPPCKTIYDLGLARPCDWTPAYLLYAPLCGI